MSAILSAIVLFQVLALCGAVLALAAHSRPAKRSSLLHAAVYPASAAVANATAVSAEEMTDVERILTTPVAAHPVASQQAAVDSQEDRAVRAA